MSDTIVRVGSSDIIVRLYDGNTLAGLDAAERAEAAADAIGQRVTVLNTAPAEDSSLVRLGEVEFLTNAADGSPITLPANLMVRELARDLSGADDRFRHRWAVFTAPSTYTVVADDSVIGDSFIDVDGYTGWRRIPIYARTTAFGVPVGTLIGYSPIDFRTGAVFGTYAATFTFAEGEVVPGRVSPTETWLANAKSAAKEAIGEFGESPFSISSATDEYVAALVPSGIVSGADKDDQLYLNIETIHFPGVPLYRVKFNLWSHKRNALVASFSYQQATDPTALLAAQHGIRLSGMVSGSHVLAPDYGIEAVLFPDWEAVEWTHPLTTYTDPTATGLRESAIRTTAELRQLWTHEAPPPAKIVTVGSVRGEYATVVAAIAAHSYGSDFIGDNTRSTHPSSAFGPEYPILFKIIDPHTEEVFLTTILGVDQSPLRLAAGFMLETRSDTLIFADTAGNSGPVIEMNHTARLFGGGRIWQKRGGYVLHIDSFNGVSADAGDEGIIRRPIHMILGDVVLDRLLDNSVSPIGSGIADDMDWECRGTRILMAANTTDAPPILIHTSPGQEVGGRIRLTDVTCVSSGTKRLSLLTSHARTTVHTVAMSGCDLTEITHGYTGGMTECGFRAVGEMTGVTVAADLRP